MLLVGDTAGFVDVPSLKGIHYAMMSGIFAARAIFEALKAKDTSGQGLEAYDEIGTSQFHRQAISAEPETCG